MKRKTPTPNRKVKSPIWEYFLVSEKDGVIDYTQVQCRECNNWISYFQSTSNLWKHMRSSHSKIYQSKFSKSSSIPATIPSLLHPLPSNKSRDITRAIAAMMAIDLQPISIVEDVAFQRLVKMLEPRYVMPKRKHFSQEVIPAMYNEVMGQV